MTRRDFIGTGAMFGAVALLSVTAMTLLFVMPAAWVCVWFGWLPRAQLLPAIMSGEVAVLALIAVSFSTNNGEQPMTRKKTAVAALTAAMAAASLVAARGDGYQFIISGDPVAAATANNSSASSATGALTSSTLADGHVLDSSLEGRYRTNGDSPARRLRSDKFHGFFIRLR